MDLLHVNPMYMTVRLSPLPLYGVRVSTGAHVKKFNGVVDSEMFEASLV